MLAFLCICFGKTIRNNPEFNSETGASESLSGRSETSDAAELLAGDYLNGKVQIVEPKNQVVTDGIRR
jgi:hypothetical protein